MLTYEDRLSVEELGQLVGLNRFRGQPVEVLTLSACESAAGDERAALVLAGLAVSSGARSVLATLWRVNDAAAADLVLATVSLVGCVAGTLSGVGHRAAHNRSRVRRWTVHRQLT